MDVLVFLDKKEQQYKERNEAKKIESSDKLPFGKYRGKSIDDVLKFDKKYLQWMMKNCNLKDNLKTRIQNCVLRDEDSLQNVL
jgi:uncharacterized protein (DUF3820 family)